MSKTVSVGYQMGMERYYPGAWAYLDRGRREAQAKYSTWAGIVWAGASRPSIYIRPTSSTKVWGQVIGNSIYVTYSRKVWKTDAQWKDVNIWRSLFLHEYAHLLVSTSHCNNPVDGKLCLLTISGARAERLCPSCLRKLVARYGKPTLSIGLESSFIDFDTLGASE